MTQPDDLRSLLSKATPGPWEIDQDDFGFYIAKADLAQPDYGATRAMPTHIGVEASLDRNTEANFAAIVTLVNLAPQLLTLWEVARELGDLWSDENENENWVPPMRMCLRLRAALNALEDAK